MKHTISVLVENKSGVLSRISGLFSRRGYNIESLTVGVTNDPEISRMTVIADGDEYIADQITKQLDKQIEVIKVKRLAPEEIIGRELLLVKVKVTPSQRREILDIVKVMNGQIIDISRETMTVELCSISSDIELITDLLSAYEILEVARTGLVALEKGSMTI